MENLADKIINKIETEKIKPLPCWRFCLARYLAWTLYGLAILIDSIIWAMIIYLIVDSDLQTNYFDVRELVNWLWFKFPLWWLLAFFALVLLAIYNFRQTRRGYRHRFAVLVAVNVLASFIIGGLFDWFRFDAELDNYLDRSIPSYYGAKDRDQLLLKEINKLHRTKMEVVR